LTKKNIDFILWSKIINIMFSKGHLTKEGLHDIVSIRASINNGLSPKLAAAFPKTIPFVRPAMELETAVLYPQWLVGFVAGDGSFSASPYSDKLKAFKHPLDFI
jgi:hypothetical protein